MKRKRAAAAPAWSPVKRYIARPVVIESVQWRGDNETELEEFMGGEGTHWMILSVEGEGGALENALMVNTPEGSMAAPLNSFIIRDSRGFFYPCDEEVFRGKYDEVIEGED